MGGVPFSSISALFSSVCGTLDLRNKICKEESIPNFSEIRNIYVLFINQQNSNVFCPLAFARPEILSCCSINAFCPSGTGSSPCLSWRLMLLQEYYFPIFHLFLSRFSLTSGQTFCLLGTS